MGSFYAMIRATNLIPVNFKMMLPFQLTVETAHLGPLEDDEDTRLSAAEADDCDTGDMPNSTSSEK